MLVLADQAHRDHNPAADCGYPEIPGQVAAIREALAGGFTIEEHHREAPAILHDIHPPEMFAYLEAFSAALPKAATRYPEIHRISALPDPTRMGRPPGFTRGYCFDQTPLTSGTARAAVAAAHRLSGEGKVAILDIDYHHGNGTQEIFYARHDVLYASIHAHPGYAYPGFSGHAEETAFDAGVGHNHNRPLGPGTGDGEFLPELSGALERIADFQPAFLVVSLGADIADWRVSAGRFSRAGEMIAGIALPTLVIQEGGYSLRQIGGDVTAFLEGFR